MTLVVQQAIQTKKETEVRRSGSKSIARVWKWGWVSWDFCCVHCTLLVLQASGLKGGGLVVSFQNFVNAHLVGSRRFGVEKDQVLLPLNENDGDNDASDVAMENWRRRRRRRRGRTPVVRSELLFKGRAKNFLLSCYTPASRPDLN